MITSIRYASLGQGNFPWLQARYHFSFSNYFNPARRGFSVMRVINDDTIKAGTGFDLHPHENMEIITYVRQGAITHRDSLGNEGRTGAGDVQVMSAGSGITHAEHNREQEDTRLYQIWIHPHTKNVAPRWEAKPFPKTPVADALPLLVSGRGKHNESGALFIYQDAAIYGGTMNNGATLTHRVEKGRCAYVLVSQGGVDINGTNLEQGDGAEIRDEETLHIRATGDAELLLIDLP